MVAAVAVIKQINKEMKMKTVNKIGISIAAALGLGFAVASVHAQQGPMGNGVIPPYLTEPRSRVN